MSYIPSSAAEVKGIIEAVNLRTKTRFTYLKVRGQVCGIPWARTPDGFKDLAALLDEQIWDHPDPDHEVIISHPPDVPPGDPSYAGDPTLYFERPPRSGELDDLQLAIWKARAAQTANPERRAPAQSANPKRTAPARELPQAPRKDNVVHLPAVEKRPVRHDRPPKDIEKYDRVNPYPDICKRIVLEMYDNSIYGPINKIEDYAGTSKKKGRYFTRGNADLARLAETHRNTVSKWLNILKKNKRIIQHRRGYPAKPNKGINPSGKAYCSIWELPFDLAHVFAWKRKHVGGRHRAF